MHICVLSILTHMRTDQRRPDDGTLRATRVSDAGERETRTRHRSVVRLYWLRRPCRAAGRAAPLRVCAGSEEQLDTLEAAGAGGRQQREVALLVVRRIRAGPGAEQPLDDVVVSEARGDGEQPEALWCARLARDAFAPGAVEPLLARAEKGAGLAR